MRAPLLAAALLGLGLAGCGDDASSTPEPAPNTMGDSDAGLAGPAPPPVQVPAGAPKVLVLGDSIAAGLHLPGDRAFPAALQRQLAAQGQPFELVNAGVSGDTSAGGLARLDWQLRQEPDVLVLELGGNDGLRGLSPQATEDNLRAIVRRAQGAGVRVLLLGVRVPPSLGPDYAAAFDGLYPRLAQELALPLVPFFMEGVGGVPELNLEDGLHPTPEGHERIAAKVAPALAKLLAELE